MSKKNKQQTNEADVIVEEVAVEETVEPTVEEKPKKQKAAFQSENIKVEAFLVPGHTWGHLVYLIDDAYLFTGDTIWFGADGGYAFLNTLAEDRKLQVKSLKRLEEILRKRNLKLKIITGHTGWTDDIDFAFAHTDEVCNALRRKPKVHDSKAPYDGFDESDDTEENVKKGYLKM